MTSRLARAWRDPLPGTRVTIPLSADPLDRAIVRVLAAPRRDLTRHGALSAPLAPFSQALLVDVQVEGRMLLPGAWVLPEVIDRGQRIGPIPVSATDLRLPAVIAGDSDAAELHWGETVWPMDLGGVVAIPDAARADPHPLSRLRRLTLIAAGRREEIGLTMWREPDFEVPWHDVRLLPHATRWFELAQVPAGMRYADAERFQGVGRAAQR